MAELLDRLALVFDRTADLAAKHAARSAPPVDDETRATELERARQARSYAQRARENATSLRKRVAPSDPGGHPPSSPQT